MVFLERISTAVPWPRGLVFDDRRLFVLARGRHRGAGGPEAGLQDCAGTIFEINHDISEPVVEGQTAGADVRRNASVIAYPHSPPFKLWDQNSRPPASDINTDRPYATLVYHSGSQNFFIGGFSGIDIPPGSFSKNATDSIHRFDLRINSWQAVEAHIDFEETGGSGNTTPNKHFPHHDVASNPPPHGWLNGPDGLVVAADQLYAVAKDNHCLARYPLDEILANPAASPPQSEAVFRRDEGIRLQGLDRDLKGPSALAVNGDYLYIGFRTTSEVVRVPLDSNGVVSSNTGELIALFDPWTPTQRSADLIDIAFSQDDKLFISTARQGVVWNAGKPDPSKPFDGRTGSGNDPAVRLRELTFNAKAKCGNIAFDLWNNLYIISGNKDDPSSYTSGVIYRSSQF